MSFQMFVHTVDTKGKLQSSVSPSSSNDLVNKSYVDSSIAAGGGDWEASVLDQLATPPGSPSSGDRYLVIATASGAWSGKENDIAEYNGSSWDFTTPTKGTHVYDEDSGNALIYNGTAWVVLANATGALIKTNNLSDVSSVGSARANLGLGALATASSVNLGTDVSGTLAVSAGGTGSTSASDARTALGLSIGSDVQAYDAQLADVAGLTPADGAVIIGDGSNFVAESGSTARTSLGLGTSAVVDLATSRSDSGKIPALASGLSGGDIAVKVGSSGTLEAVTSFTLSNISDSGGAAAKDVALSGGGSIITSGRVFVADSSSTFSAGDLLKVKSDGTLEPGSSGGTGTVTSITPDADSGTGTAITSSGSIKIQGDGAAISTAVSGTDVTVSAADASTSAKGVAKFSSDNFAVSSGEVTIKAAGIDLESEVTGKLPISEGGTGADSATAARSSLGLAIGSDVQAYSLNLTAIGSVSPSNGDTLLYTGGAWDKQAYGEFDEPVKLYTSVPTVGSSGTTIAPSSVSTAFELYILDLSSASSASTLTLPTPASGDVGKSIEVKLMGSMSSSNKLTVSVSGGSDKFDGLTSIDMDQDYQRLKFTVMAAGGSGNDCYALG
tara:strand:+ start:1090 stop:2928 length:1839 start_codon:yes stop_codon:yes gene_type:complete